jgi:hypothetical protein
MVGCGKCLLPKLEVSSKVAMYMNIDRNKSVSFRCTMDAVRKLTAMGAEGGLWGKDKRERESRW